MNDHTKTIPYWRNHWSKEELESRHGATLDDPTLAILGECQTMNEVLNCLAFIRLGEQEANR
jgi:hypothetical protein